MGKGKKKHKKRDQVSEDLLDMAAISVRKFRKVTKEVQKLSTGQKIVGGIALLAAGLTYLSKLDLNSLGLNSDEKPEPEPRADTLRLAPHRADAPADEAPEPDSKPSAPRKSRKATKPKHEA